MISRIGMIKKIKNTLPKNVMDALKPLWNKWKHRPWNRMMLRLDEPIFIVGHPRSGTSWLNKLVSSHPNLAGAPESHLFNLYLAPFFKKHDRDWLAEWIPVGYRHKSLRQFTDNIFAYRLLEEQKSRIVEKTPTHRLYIKQIKALYPKAKFIHIIRDGRDVAVSLFQSFTPIFDWAPKNITEAADQWVATLEKVENGKVRFPDDILDIKYEDLVRHPEGQLQSLFAFLGENRNGRIISGILEQFPRQTGSLCRWKTALSEQQVAEFEEKAGDWLKKLDYEVYGERV